MNQNVTGNQRLREQVAQALVSQRRENGQVWLHTQGRLFRIGRVLLWIVTLINFLFYAAYLLARFFAHQDALTYTDNPDRAVFAQSRNSMYLTLFALVFLLAGVVLLQLRKHVASGACYLLSGVPMIIHFGQAMDLTLNLGSYLLRHVLPLGVMILCSVYMIVTALLDRAEVNAAYNRALEKIYDRYHKGDEITTPAQWSAYLEEYLAGNSDIRAKRSVRERRRKQAERAARQEKSAGEDANR